MSNKKKITGNQHLETNKLTADIVDYLLMHGVWAWRENNQAVPIQSGGQVVGFRSPGIAGKPDILGYLPPDGQGIGIEVKTGSDRLRPEQVGFHANTRRMGAIVLVVHTWPDFLEQIKLACPQIVSLDKQ